MLVDSFCLLLPGSGDFGTWTVCGAPNKGGSVSGFSVKDVLYGGLLINVDEDEELSAGAVSALDIGGKIRGLS